MIYWLVFSYKITIIKTIFRKRSGVNQQIKIIVSSWWFGLKGRLNKLPLKETPQPFRGGFLSCHSCCIVPKVSVDWYLEAKRARQRQRASPSFSSQNSWSLQCWSRQEAWRAAATDTHTHTQTDELHFQTIFSQQTALTLIFESLLFVFCVNGSRPISSNEIK